MPKYLLRLFSFSFILAAIPVISIGLISYLIASNDIEDKVKEGNMQVLLQTQMRVEQVLKTLELTSLQYINSPLVNGALNASLTADDFIEVRNLSTGLYNLQTFAGIRDAHLINLQKDWVVSFASFGKYSSAAERDTFAAYAKHPNSSLFWVTSGVKTGKTGDNADKPADSDDKSAADAAVEETTSLPSIRMVYKIPVVPTTGQPKALLVVEILNSQVKSLISNNKKLGDVFILDRDGRNFLGENSDPETNKAIHELVLQKVRATDEESGFLNTSVNGTELGVSYRSSPYNGWVYISAVSIEDITKQSKKIAWITFFVCAILFLLIALFAFYGSRKMYSPIKRLFEFTRGIQVEGQDDRYQDEFVSIEERFRTLFSTEKQLQQQVSGQVTQLKEFFVLKLFSGQLSDNDFAYRSQMYGFPSDWKRLGVLTLQIDALQESRYGEHDRELLLFAINNIVGELVPQNRRFSPVLLDQSQVTLITSDSDDEEELKAYLHQTAELVKEKVNEFLQLQVSIGISRPFRKVTEAVQGYGESLEALKCRMSLGHAIIVHFEDIDAGKKAMEVTVYTQLKMLEDQLVNALKLGDVERVDAVFDKYISAIVEKGIHFNEYPALMMQLISKAFQLVQEQGGSVNNVLGEKASFEHFMKLNTLEDIIRWFKTVLFEPIIAFLNLQAESQYLNIANQMVKLVHERFDQEISLEACGSILNFHPVYLSRVFKKEMGINFSEYLADYRMNMAKSWLESTNWKISEIAEKLSYTNTTAFIRTFRKIVGVTPGQYRDQYNKQ
ncbi:helix-turn-helix domain-containing protein [Paenibacillus piri]|uniref:Helix-turn-helix domain-containing protein n=1 Tax=Paenibacillus piri TaxID=2547395 RepID=A0A4R5KUL2_9BACL|nr:helix-turn-helix domain-containing protein [Paenibacillus piri]TDF98610.1 helix-turn-helix domain-containing protein [Paenibacillus piri]